MSDQRPRAGRVVGIAEGVATAVRRRQREREPRVALFGAGGDAHVVAPSAPGYDELLEVAGAVLELAGDRTRDPRPRSSSAAAAEPRPADASSSRAGGPAA